MRVHRTLTSATLHNLISLFPSWTSGAKSTCSSASSNIIDIALLGLDVNYVLLRDLGLTLSTFLISDI